MAIVHECDDGENAVTTLSIPKNNNLWNSRMRGCMDILGQVDFNRIIKEVYGDIDVSFRDTDSESSSLSSSVEVLIEIADSFDQ